ncbi:Long_chain fatty acid CoA ligase [Hexamita inflata]|uniref:Long chain fatty acid CoA ligase n=1 Tax=Hexamita inflata TaxID=28002 RepID=A0AA86UZR0_9EUKA|nr:Long chain fatty acid CoA ligase [Hexamita inflata]
MQSVDLDFNQEKLDIPEQRQTFPKSLRMTANCYPKRRFLGTREFLDNGQRGAYEWYSYQEIYRLSCLLSTGLTEIGLKRGDKVGIIVQTELNGPLLKLPVELRASSWFPFTTLSQRKIFHMFATMLTQKFVSAPWIELKRQLT